jgi:taurine--2-oxoglutarate transaminase
VDQARAGGVSFAARSNLLFLAPPLVITEGELDEALRVLDALLTDLEAPWRS